MIVVLVGMFTVESPRDIVSSIGASGRSYAFATLLPLIGRAVSFSHMPVEHPPMVNLLTNGAVEVISSERPHCCFAATQALAAWI